MLVACFFLLLPTAASGTGCSNELTVDQYYTKKQAGDFDAIIDVRAPWEYSADVNSASCTGDKCSLGHDMSMHLLPNPDDATLGVLLKNNGTRYVVQSALDAFVNCYASRKATMKVVVSCHSGTRSGLFQQALVDNGFTCANVYNLVAGAQGTFDAWNSTGRPDDHTKVVMAASPPGVWTCPSAASNTTNAAGGGGTTESTSSFASTTSWLGVSLLASLASLQRGAMPGF